MLDDKLDYKEMYFELFRTVDKVISQLIQARRNTEALLLTDYPAEYKTNNKKER